MKIKNQRIIENERKEEGTCGHQKEWRKVVGEDWDCEKREETCVEAAKTENQLGKKEKKEKGKREMCVYLEIEIEIGGFEWVGEKRA